MARRPLERSFIGSMSKQEFESLYREYNRPPFARFMVGALIGGLTAFVLALVCMGHTP